MVVPLFAQEAVLGDHSESGSMHTLASKVALEAVVLVLKINVHTMFIRRGTRCQDQILREYIFSKKKKKKKKGQHIGAACRGL